MGRGSGFFFQNPISTLVAPVSFFSFFFFSSVFVDPEKPDFVEGGQLGEEDGDEADAIDDKVKRVVV